MKKTPSDDFIAKICDLYGDSYDDRKEDSRLKGDDWAPGKRANHLSLSRFQSELKDMGIELSSSKLRKILITGGCWSTKRSREVEELYGKYGSMARVADKLGISASLVYTYLPYKRVVYDLEDKSANAKRIQRWRKNLNVIFDMDGVIFDSERFYIECHIIAAKKVGLDRMEQMAYQCIGITEKETEKKLWQEYGADAPVREFLQETKKTFKERYNEFGLPLKEGVIELLQFLQESNAKIAIASSTEVNTVKTELRDAGLIHFFNVIVGGNMVEASKPEPDIFLKAAKDLQRDIKDCYIIEDSFNGVRAAHKAGGKVFMVPDLLQPTEEIRMLTDRAFISLVDVKEYFKGI